MKQENITKITPDKCRKCRFCGHIETSNSNVKGLTGRNCDYALITGHSRTIGPNGQARLPKGYCDKYETGQTKNHDKWTSDDMTFVKSKKNIKIKGGNKHEPFYRDEKGRLQVWRDDK